MPKPYPSSTSNSRRHKLDPKQRKKRRTAKPGAAADSLGAAEGEGSPRGRQPRRRLRRRAQTQPAPLEDKAPPRTATDRPDFIAQLPDDEHLAPLVAAFERGDYGSLRKQAAALARSTRRKSLRRAARELVRRTKPDPLAIYLVGLAFALWVFLVLWTYLVPHAHWP